MPERIWTLPQVADVAEVEYRTLHTWLKRGLLTASVRHSIGTGTPNLFSDEDAVAARVLADLRRAGLSMEVLGRASEALRQAPEALSEPRIVVVNGAVDVVEDASAAAEAVDRPGLSMVYRTLEALRRVEEGPENAE